MSRGEEAKSDHACHFQRDFKLIEIGANPHGSKESKGKKHNKREKQNKGHDDAHTHITAASISDAILVSSSHTPTISSF